MYRYAPRNGCRKSAHSPMCRRAAAAQNGGAAKAATPTGGRRGRTRADISGGSSTMTGKDGEIHQPDHEIPLGRVVLTCLAVLSAAAAVIHFAAAADYFQGYWLFSLSMLVAAWLQAAWAAVAVIRPSRGLLQAGAWLNGLILALYLITQATGDGIGTSAARGRAVRLRRRAERGTRSGADHRLRLAGHSAPGRPGWPGWRCGAASATSPCWARTGPPRGCTA